MLYLGDTAPGAIAEAFGRFPEWTASILEGVPDLPKSVRALARFRTSRAIRVCDLDDPAQLQALALRPSDVVTRDYTRSRAGPAGFTNGKNGPVFDGGRTTIPRGTVSGCGISKAWFWMT